MRRGRRSGYPTGFLPSWLSHVENPWIPGPKSCPQWEQETFGKGRGEGIVLRPSMASFR